MNLPKSSIEPCGKLFMPPDVNGAREFFHQKDHSMVDKRMSVSAAVQKYVHDGDYLATGGFGGVRISSALLHEIVRARKKNLGLAGHTTTHDFQILSAGHCFNRVDVAYIVGLELRGLSPNARRVMQSGEVEVTEWTNATLNWRYKAAAMGVPFLPVRSLLGTDSLKYSAAKEITCPYTNEKFLVVPALFPDVAVVHVHRADIYGNAQIDGISIADYDVVRASKRVLVTTERIVDTSEIRKNPITTVVPYWLVDAVCEVPFGSYPGNMPYEYYSDEDHLAEWMQAEVNAETFNDFLDKYIYGVKTFEEYLSRACSPEKLEMLQRIEPLKREVNHG
jgi:glutaconate CoA-transferase subunit A